LWRLRRDDAEVECRARLMPYGIEIDVSRDGKTVLTRTFETDREALSWADGKRAARESEGWVLVAAPPRDGQERVV
jgi:hypothetical protein